MNTIESLQRKIMRRVYYAFGIRLATHPLTLHAVVLASAGYMLASLVFVQKVIENIATTEVADLGGKLVRILFHADLPSLIMFAIVIATLLSLQQQLPVLLSRMRSPRIA